MKPFVHEHFHTSWSLLDGYNPIPKAIKRLKELGMTACAITDHNHIAGCPQFQKECLNNGIKPLLGCELYFTPSITEMMKPASDRRQEAIDKALKAGVITEKDIEKKKVKELNEIIAPYKNDQRDYHIILIAKNQTGWNNLVKIVSESARLCTYNGRHHCDYDLLRKYHEGVICSTACIGSYPSHKIVDNNFDKALEYLDTMRDIFQDDFYLEIQPLNITRQHLTNLFYMKYSEEYDVKCIATNDVHWTYYEDYDDHDTLICISLKSWKDNPNRKMVYMNDFWIKSREEMEESFADQIEDLAAGKLLDNDLDPSEIDFEVSVTDFEVDIEDYKAFCMKALDTTVELANKVSEDIKLGSDKPLFSKVQVPAGLTPEQWLECKAWKGLYKYLNKHEECDVKLYCKRLRDELDIIIPKGFAPYFLAVEEYVTWANEHSCPTGPGRGSAAGSLLLFSLGVTKNIDPIKNKLWFSRFMTAERTAMPDIDIDFLYEKRESVVKHLEDYYGKENVAHIGTYSVLGVKSAIKDVARAINIFPQEANAITKEIDAISDDPGLSFKMLDGLKDSENKNERDAWERFDRLEKKYSKLFNLCRKFEGQPRQFGVHASGVLVTPMPVTDMFPCRYDKDTGTAITLYTGTQLEELNSVKYDILGLKTISVIVKALKMIDENLTINDLYDEVKFDDKSIYEYISSKQTDSVFQLSSNLMKGLIGKMQPTEFNDIVATNALGRPGPLQAGFDTLYADGKNGELSEPPIRGCDDLLKDTYNVICYQETLMAVSKRIAGFSDGQADLITRKITAKKRKEMFPMMIRCHIYGKKNCEGPEGWENDDNAPWYDPKGKYGGEIKGALSKGYTEKEVRDYFDKIMGFSSYAFNLSHACCYAYLSILTAYLKMKHPAEFMAAVLTMEDDPKKLSKTLSIVHDMGITVSPPDINLSDTGYTVKDKNTILYGLGAVKSVGEKSLPDIIKNRPYKDIEDAYKRIPKAAFKKNTAENLIKAGAFDFCCGNRHTLINRFMNERKNDKIRDKDFVELDPDGYNEKVCMRYEEEMLGTHLTYRNWWEDLEENRTVSITVNIKEVREHMDKNGKLMAFVTALYDDIEISCVIFSSKYVKLNLLFCGRERHNLIISGKKTDNNTFIINEACPAAIS